VIFVFRLSIANFLLNQNRVAAFFNLQQLCRNLSFVSKFVGRLDYRRRHDTIRKATLPKEVENGVSAKPTNLSSVSYDPVMLTRPAPSRPRP